MNAHKETGESTSDASHEDITKATQKLFKQPALSDEVRRELHKLNKKTGGPLSERGKSFKWQPAPETSAAAAIRVERQRRTARSINAAGEPPDFVFEKLEWAEAGLEQAQRNYKLEHTERVKAERQRDKALGFIRDIATAQIRGATQEQLRSMLVDAIADLESEAQQ